MGLPLVSVPEHHTLGKPSTGGFISFINAPVQTDLASLDADAYVAPSTITVRQLLEDRWLPAMGLGVRPTTLRGYRQYALSYIAPHLGGLRLQRLTTRHVDEWLATLSGHLSPSTVRNAARTLARAVEFALKHDLVARNVVKAAAVPRPPRSQRQALTVDAARRILADMQARASWVAPAVALAMYTGLRRSEVIGLRWADIDFDRSLLFVRRGYHHLGGPSGGIEVVREPKSAASIRAVELMQQTVVLLRDMHMEAERRAGLLAQPLTLDDYLFATVEGRPYRPASLSGEFWRTAKRLGLKARFHDLRHLHASLLLSLNVHPKVVQARLGHSTIAVTLDLYSHLMPGMGRQAADALEGALDGGHQRLALGPAQ